jgi:Family of unknown function (DUF6481)
MPTPRNIPAGTRQTMRDFKKGPKLEDRLVAAAKAREAMLARYKAGTDATDPEIAARRAEKAKADQEREARRAVQEAEKAVRRAEDEARRAAEAEAAKLAAVAEQAAREAAEEENRRQQKEKRDARYAARKARK